MRDCLEATMSNPRAFDDPSSPSPSLCPSTRPCPLLTAQATDRDLEAIASWVAVDAATGYERRVAPGTGLGARRLDR